jgi:tetratricopeptide (TPR) repeat protein
MVDSCIICHMKIIDGLEKKETCPNNHPIHGSCLMEWLIKSNTCPLCSEPYAQEVLLRFEDYVKQKNQEKINEFENQIKAEQMGKVNKVTEKVIFLKSIENIEKLVENQEYNLALNEVESLGDFPLTSYKGQKAIFLKGKINFFRKRFDLAINLLFRLVKENFDFPEGFLYLGKSYEALGLIDKAKWAYERAK